MQVGSCTGVVSKLGIVGFVIEVNPRPSDLVRALKSGSRVH